MSGLVFRPEKLFRYKKPALVETDISPRWQCVRPCDYFQGLTRFAFTNLKIDVDLLRLLICFQMRSTLFLPTCLRVFFYFCMFCHSFFSFKHMA